MTTNHATLDGKLFIRHLKTLKGSWANKEKWLADAYAFIGGVSNDEEFSKTSAIQHWLCGYELTDTLMVICENSVFVLTNKVSLFNSMQHSFDETINFTVLKMNKKEGNAASINIIIENIRKSFFGTTVGTFLNEQQQGPLVTEWQAAVVNSKLKQVDVSTLISDILAVKDQIEQKCVRTAASISVAVLKNYLFQRIEDIIDEEKKELHTTIAEETEKLFENPEKISPKLNPNVVESCYTPIIQSGNYNLELLAPNTGSYLEFNGTIVCSLGARYKAYCSDVARTYFLDPTEDQKECYTLLCEIQERIIKLLKPNAQLSEIWNRVVELIDAKLPSLRPNFLPSCGTSIGLEYSDPDYSISADCNKIVAPSMVFNIRVGFRNLKKANSNTTYAMLLADTVLVGQNGAEVLTSKCTKKFSEVSYEVGEDDKVKEEAGNKKKPSPAKPKGSTTTTTKRTPPPKREASGGTVAAAAAVRARKTEKKQPIHEEEYARSTGFSLRKTEKLNTINVGTRSLRKTVAREMKHNKSSTAESKRIEHQKQLEEQLIRRAKQLLKKKGNVEEESAQAKEFIAYGNPKDYPSESSRDAIYVDVNREAVLLPIYGLQVPFHITTIKNISKNDDYIRVIFKLPGSSNQTGTVPQLFNDLGATYIKELTFRVPNESSLNITLRGVNELKKRVSTRETEIHQKATLKDQPALILSKVASRIPRLSHLSVRPIIGGKRTIGTLEAHVNGFRYSTSKNNVKVEELDIIYENLKHGFFQHAENSLIVALHFHLHNEIMIGKKKSKDVQFYMEVMEVSTALNQPRQRSRYGDAEEIEDEQREREMRNKLNRDFQSFVKKVEEMVPTIEFDVPYRELGFCGVHFRNNVFLTPTVHCLINVIEYPFFVMSLDDVQIAYFERVQFSLRAFDLVFIFNDWSQKEVHINSIPVESLETIKDWLDSCNIKYYQGPTNLNWRGLLDVAAGNPKKFWADGGWSVLDNTTESGDEQEGHGGDDQEPGVGPDEYRPSSSSESDYEMQQSSEEDAPGQRSRIDEEDEDFIEKVDDPGLDWEEMEEHAVKHDKKAALKRTKDFDSDNESPAAGNGRQSKRPRKK